MNVSEIKILNFLMILESLNKPIWLLEILIMGCRGVSKMECWCVWSGHWAVDTEDSGIMKHNAARAEAFCWINPKLHPKPSEHPPGREGGGTRSSPQPLTPESLGLERRWGGRLSVAAAADDAACCQPLQPAVVGPAPRCLILANPPSIIQQTY